MGYPVGGEFYSVRGGIGQQYEGGYILGIGKTGYWESKGLIRSRYAQLGYENGEMGYPTGPITCTADNNCQQAYEGGIIYAAADGTTSYTRE